MATGTNRGSILAEDVVAGGGIRGGCSSSRDLAPVRVCLLGAPIAAYWALGVSLALGVCSAQTILLTAPVIAVLTVCLTLLCGSGSGRRLAAEDAG